MKKYLKTVEEVMRALKEGKTVKNENGDAYVLKDGLIVQTFLGNLLSLNATIFFDENLYAEEPDEQLKIEVGKFYKTRDGRKAFVYANTDEEVYYYWAVIVNSGGGPFRCTVDGRFCYSVKSANDLVASWEETK